MKKLLIPLFLILISFNSYGEWQFVSKSTTDESHYIDTDTIKEHNGYFFWWALIDFPKDADGDMSIVSYTQGDCSMSRQQIQALYIYKKPMGNGSNIHINGDGKWDYVQPGTMGFRKLNFVCDFIKK